MTSKPYLHIMKCLFLGGLLAICAFFEISQAYAYGWKDVNRARSGWVLARGLVLEEGHPVYVEYDEAGNLAGGFSMSAAELPEGYVLSAQQVRATYELLNVIKAQSPQSIILSAEQYREKEFKTALDTTLAKVYLPSHIKSVVIRDPSTLLSASQAHILLQARFDLNSVSAPSSGIRSLLLDGRGAVVHESANNISFKAAFYDGEGGEQLLPPSLKDLNGVKTYAPFVGAGVEVVAPLGGHAATNAEGRWVSQYRLIPCPMFHFEYSTPAIMKYYYGAYNPRGSGAGFDYQIKPGYDVCVGYDALQATDLVGLMVKANIIGILASLSEPVKKPTNFYVDTNLITGGAFVTNDGSPLPIGDSTRYSYQQPEQAPIAFPNVDFDGDLNFEHFVLGDIDEQGNFFCVQQSAEGKYVGVYFSSNYSQLPALDCTDSENEEVQPDAVRVADTLIDMQPQGLLEKITEVDLQDTDILVFRESTGMLVTQRKGLSQQDGLSRYGVEENVFMYQLFMRGPAASAFSPSGRSQGEAGFARYQGESHMNPELHRREADHLRPHERLKIVLINRKTGYIGTAVKTFADIASMQHAADFVSRIAMYPPNLQLTAERFYQADEYTANPGEKQHIISYEGSATGADDMIVVTTQWLDHDGTPLPDGLAEYGYTGRLSAVKGPNNLVTVGGNMANFAIRPGRNVVQIRLPQQANRNEHFYIHVSGEPITESPSFATIGAADEGPLKYRPAHYVPIKVPVFDELQTNQQWYAYKKLQANGEANNIPKPKPVYRYLYRPEYQFSTYELDVQNIIRENSKGESINLFPQSRPLIGSSDNMVALLYKVIASQSDALQFLGQGQELVFALGADEIKATIGENGQVIFKRLDHIAALDVEDFVTLSLYNNTDPTNVLWEYAFRTLTLVPSATKKAESEKDTIFLTADAVANSLHSVTAVTSPSSQGLEKLYWSIEGQGQLLTDTTTSTNGYHVAKASLSTVAGSKTTIKSLGFDGVSEFSSLTIETLPGVIADLTLQGSSGKTAVGGLGEVTLDILATDAFGNAVVDGSDIDVESETLEISRVSTTKNGIFQIVVRGMSTAEENTLTVSYADTQQQFQVHVHNIELTINEIANPKINSQGQFTVSASSSYGSLDGAEVELALHRGKLQFTKATLDASGSITVPFTTGEFPGYAHFSARIPTTAVVKNFPFAVEPEEDYLDSYILTTGGEVTLEYGNNDQRTFSSQTQLHINTVANDEVDLSIGDIFDPPVYPLSDYNADFGIIEQNRLIDYANGIHAITKNIALTEAFYDGSTHSYTLSQEQYKQSYIDIPKNDRVKSLTQAGINFSFKSDALSKLSAEATLVEWSSLGLSLGITTERQLMLKTEHEGKAKRLVLPKSLKPGQWHNIAAHYVDGQLQLGLDGEIVKLESSLPEKQADKLYALRISPDINAGLDSFSVTKLKLYDWEGSAKLTFDDGNFTQQATASASGKLEVGIEAQTPVNAYNFLGSSEFENSGLASLIIGRAYASEPMSQCFQIPPEDPTHPDSRIDQFDALISLLVSCMFKDKLEKAHIRYEKASGFRETAVALAELSVLEASHAVLTSLKDKAVFMANCLDGVWTGGNTSAGGMACDFITSFFLVGDLRDLAKQIWLYHYYPDEYDELEAQLAALGIAAFFLQVTTAPGVILNATVASLKIVAKVLKVMGRSARLVAKLIGRRIYKILESEGDWTSKAKKFELILPFAELMAALALIRRDNPQVFDVVLETISTEKGQTAMIDWFRGYSERFVKEFAWSNSPPAQSTTLPWLIPQAHAGFSADLQEQFIKEMSLIIKRLQPASNAKIGRDFAQALQDFNRFYDAGTLVTKSPEFIGKVDDFPVLNALMNVRKLGDANTVRRFAEHGAYTLGYGPKLFDGEKYIKAFADLKVDELTEETRTGLRYLLNRFEGHTSNPKSMIAKGDIAHAFLVLDMHKAGYKIIAVEKTINLGQTRRIDIVAEIDGKIVRIEVKNSQDGRWRDRLRDGLSMKMGKDGEPESVGQLLDDLGNFINNGYSGYRWAFTPDVLPNSRTLDKMPDKASLQVYRDEMVDYLLDSLDNKRVSYLMKKAGYDKAELTDDTVRKDFITSLVSAVENEDFFDVIDYKNIVKG